VVENSQVEIAELGVACCAAEDVFQFDVAVRDAGCVHGGQRAQQRRGDLCGSSTSSSSSGGSKVQRRRLSVRSVSSLILNMQRRHPAQRKRRHGVNGLLLLLQSPPLCNLNCCGCWCSAPRLPATDVDVTIAVRYLALYDTILKLPAVAES
jgi:hypothetical protein